MTLKFDLTQAEPALQLSLACIQTDESGEVRFEQVVEKEVDWERWASFSRAHGLLPLAYPLFNRFERSWFPDWVIELVKQVYRLNTFRSLQFANRLLGILNEFDRLGLPAIALRGPALASKLYVEPGLRMFSDLDLLIRPGDFPRVYKRLVENGYKAAFSLNEKEQRWITRGDRDFTFTNQGVHLEVHWQVDESVYQYPLMWEHFWERECWVEVLGKPVRTFCESDLLLTLCMHGTRHRWERLIWLADLVRFFDAYPDFDLQAFWQWISELGFRRVVGVSLALAESLGGVMLPDWIWEQLEGDRTICDLCTQLVNQLIFQKNKVEGEETYLAALNSSRFDLAVREGWNARANLVWDRLFVPRQSDWLGIGLPERFYWLLSPFRPLRMVVEAVRQRLLRN